MSELFELEEDDFYSTEEELESSEDSLDGLDDLEEDSSNEVLVEEEVVEESSEDLVEESKPTETTIERYSSSDISYPCFVLNGSGVFPKHVVSALSRMIESSLSLEDTIKVYVSNGDELLSLGGISSLQVKAVIDLLGRENISAYYEEGYLLKGDLIYTLSI